MLNGDQTPRGGRVLGRRRRCQPYWGKPAVRNNRGGPGKHERKLRAPRPCYELCQAKSQCDLFLFPKSVFSGSLSGGVRGSKRYPGAGNSGGRCSACYPCAAPAGTAHYDLSGHGQETSAPNLPNGPLPAQGRLRARAVSNRFESPASGFKGWGGRDAAGLRSEHGPA